jgi:hypothetical protein
MSQALDLELPEGLSRFGVVAATNRSVELSKLLAE